MNHESESGDLLWKSIRVRVFGEENRSSTVTVIKADPGKGFTEKHIDNILDRVAENLEKQFPSFEFSLVPLGQAHFNFVWKAHRVAPANQEPVSA